MSPNCRHRRRADGQVPDAATCGGTTHRHASLLPPEPAPQLLVHGPCRWPFVEPSHRVLCCTEPGSAGVGGPALPWCSTRQCAAAEEAPRCKARPHIVGSRASRFSVGPGRRITPPTSTATRGLAPAAQMPHSIRLDQSPHGSFADRVRSGQAWTPSEGQKRKRAKGQPNRPWRTENRSRRCTGPWD